MTTNDERIKEQAAELGFVFAPGDVVTVPTPGTRGEISRGRVIQCELEVCSGGVQRKYVVRPHAPAHAGGAISRDAIGVVGRDLIVLHEFEVSA